MSNDQTEKPLHVQTFTSSRNPKKTYTTYVFDTFEHCNCAGFKHREKCRHCVEAREIFLNK